MSEKEDSDALDNLRDSYHFMAFGNDQRLRDRRIYSYPSGNRYRGGAHSDYPRPETAIAICAVEA